MIFASRNQFFLCIAIILTGVFIIVAAVLKALSVPPALIIALLISTAMLAAHHAYDATRHYARESWKRPIDSVLVAERQAIPACTGPDDIVIQFLSHKVWWGHAVSRATDIKTYQDADRIVIAYYHDEVIGMFQNERSNWFVFGSGNFK